MSDGLSLIWLDSIHAIRLGEHFHIYDANRPIATTVEYNIATETRTEHRLAAQQVQKENAEMQPVFSVKSFKLLARPLAVASLIDGAWDVGILPAFQGSSAARVDHRYSP